MYKALLLTIFFATSCGFDSTNQRSAENDSSASFSLLASEGNHYILIHGGGPNFIVKMDKFAKRLTAKGVSKSRIHQLTYNYKSSVVEMSEDVKRQTEALLAKLPTTVKLNVFGHSLGNFVAMHAMASLEDPSRVNKFIGLAGVALGQDVRPGYCDLVGCPEYMEELYPYKNDFILDFIDDHKDAIEEWDHCALYSKADRRVKAPYDAGVIVSGTGHKLDRVSHLGFITNGKAFEQIISTCFDNKLD